MKKKKLPTFTRKKLPRIDKEKPTDWKEVLQASKELEKNRAINEIKYHIRRLQDLIEDL
jgi:hypothetical protein